MLGDFRGLDHVRFFLWSIVFGDHSTEVIELRKNVHTFSLLLPFIDHTGSDQLGAYTFEDRWGGVR